jgi:hypothetical protein
MKDEALDKALEALEISQGYVIASANAKFAAGWGEQLDRADIAITAIKQARSAPAQEPCGWQFYQDGKWHNGMETSNHRANTEAAGVPTRNVYPAAPVQEPVAWRWTNGKGWLTYGEMPHDRFESTPLYTTPPAAQPAPVQERCDMGDICAGCSPRNADGRCPHEKPNLACDCYVKGFNDGMKEMDGMELYTTPPAAQRQWVGLTEPVRQQIVQKFCLNVGDWTQNGKSVAIAVEAELKKNNGAAQRKWVNLPDEEIKILWVQYRAALPRYLCFAKALLRRSKEENT